MMQMNERSEAIRRAQRAMLFGSFSSRSPKLDGSDRSSRRLSSDLSTATRETRRLRSPEPQCGQTGSADAAAEKVW